MQQLSVPVGPSESEMVAFGYKFRREGRMVPDGTGGLVEQVIVDPPSALPTPTPVQKKNSPVTIYFVGSDSGPIKIGMARCVKTRLRDLQMMNPSPLQLWASVKGTADTEREYHAQFAHARTHGEWFARTPELMAEIERLNNAA